MHITQASTKIEGIGKHLGMEIVGACALVYEAHGVRRTVEYNHSTDVMIIEDSSGDDCLGRYKWDGFKYVEWLDDPKRAVLVFQNGGVEVRVILQRDQGPSTISFKRVAQLVREGVVS